MSRAPLFQRLLTILSIAFLLEATIGCGPSVRMPNLWDPGNAASQQYGAIYHDPYPIDDLGQPIEGGRPLEYQVAVPPVVRAQLSAPPRSVVVAPPGS